MQGFLLRPAQSSQAACRKGKEKKGNEETGQDRTGQERKRKWKKRKEKGGMPFSINLMRSQVLYRAAQGAACMEAHEELHKACLHGERN